jgi:D-alanine-D-alanine ligase
MTNIGENDVEMNKRIRIGIIFGGRSGEHEVSLMSARSVLSVLDPRKYDVVQIGITRRGKWFISHDPQTTVLDALQSGKTGTLVPAAMLPDTGNPIVYEIQDQNGKKTLEPVSELDVIFPVMHGTFGEDGTIQGLFEMMDVAYVGSGVLGSSVGMDKALFKDVMRTHHLPVVDSITVSRGEIEHELTRVLQDAERISAYPLFVKPANLGSSVGVSKCRNRSDLLEGMMEAARFDRRVLIEKGVNAREIEVAVLGNNDPKAAVPGEICPRQDFYTYNAKYQDESTEQFIPAPLDAETTARLQDLAVQAFKACDCAGLARVDFLIDKDNGEAWISEINTIPGFTKISMYPKLWEASGIPYSELVNRLVELALERKHDRDRTERTYGSVG